MELIVCGSRTWFDVPTIDRVAEQLVDKYGSDLVIKHGGAGGAETLAHAAFVRLGVRCEVFLPDWKGKSAYPAIRRNLVMIESGCQGVVAFSSDNCPGAAHVLAVAEDKGIKTWMIRPYHFDRIPHP